jgi:DNA-directed RNA polymerase specialized sigma24 family protein
MSASSLQGAGNRKDVSTILEQLDGHIRILALKHVPRQISSRETVDLDVAELAQKVRIKLWLALEKEPVRPIRNLNAYVGRIVYHESVSMVRAHKYLQPLFVDDDGELSYGQALITADKAMQDPSDVVEQEEQLEECLQRAIIAVKALPPRQRQAMLCTLNDYIEDVPLILDYMQNNSLSVSAAQWPQDERDLRSLKALLSVSRKKVRRALLN